MLIHIRRELSTYALYLIILLLYHTLSTNTGAAEKSYDITHTSTEFRLCWDYKHQQFNEPVEFNRLHVYDGTRWDSIIVCRTTTLNWRWHSRNNPCGCVGVITVFKVTSFSVFLFVFHTAIAHHHVNSIKLSKFVQWVYFLHVIYECIGKSLHKYEETETLDVWWMTSNVLYSGYTWIQTGKRKTC